MATHDVIADGDLATPDLFNERFAAVNFALNAKTFGAVGDGETNDTVALQAWLDAVVATQRTGFLPDGEYVHNGTLTLTAAGEREHQLDFDSNAFLCPTAGSGLYLNLVGRVLLNGPKVKFQNNNGVASTATSGIRLTNAIWVTMRSPVVWAFINPSSFIPIDVDDNSYWCTVDGLTCERPTGGGLFPAVVRFRDESNAGVVINSAISHFVDGIQMDGANGLRVCHNAIEGGTYGVRAVQTGATSNAGLIVANNRFEATTKDVKIDSYEAPYEVQVIANFHAVSDPVDNTAGAVLMVVTRGMLLMEGDIVRFGNNGSMEMVSDLSGGGIVRTKGYLALNSDSDGDAAGDIRLQANGVNKLITGPAGVGFHGQAAAGQQVITGSRGGNAALANLLTALTTIGLITDSTS